MKKFLLILFVPFLFTACKTAKQSASSSSSHPKSSLSEAQRSDVTYLFYNANKEKILGNMNNAADLFAEVIRKDGSNHAAMYELGNIYVEQKKYNDALFFLRSAYKLDNNNQWYALSLVDALQKVGRFEEAIGVLDQLTKEYPERVDYYFELATGQIIGGKLADAIKTLDKIEGKIGMNKDLTMQKQRLYMQLGKTDKAIAEVQKFIDANPKDAPAYGMLAELYQNIGQKEKALETYNKVLEIDPENPYIHLSLADYYRKNGQKEKSIEELKKAFSNKGLDVETKVQILASYYALIELHPEMKEQAMEMAKLLLEAHPNESRVHAVYGDFLFQDKQYKEAREEYRKALKLGSKEFIVTRQVLQMDAVLQQWDTLYMESQEAINSYPEQPITYFYSGLARSQQKKYADAVKLYNQGLKLVVDDSLLQEQFYTSLGDAYQELKEYAKSEESYEKALEINPKDATVLNNYAYFLSLRGDRLDKAEKMSKESNDIQPAQSSFEDTYGWIMFKQGKYSDARIWIEKAMTHGADKSGTVLEHYGDILFKLGDLPKALEYWQKAKDAGEGSELLDKKLTEKKLVD